MTSGFRFGEGLSIFKDRIRVIPQAADDLKATAREKLEWLNGLIEGREFIVGDRFTLADVLLFGFLEFGATVGQPLDAKLENLQGWYTRVASRPSIEASKA
jgi:glutathione S-transferase